MLIKFGLPNGAGGMAAGYAAGQLRKLIKDFEQQTNVSVRTWSFNKDHRHWIGCDIPTKHELLFTVYMADKNVFMRYEPLD